MRELNRNHVYSLKDLTSEEKQQLLEKLRELDDSWAGRAPRLQLFSSKYLYYTNSYNTLGGWFVSDEIYYTVKEIINAKELFYTLESTQNHYDNTNGSIYKFCNDQKLNSWEFDIIKRVVRCRKKWQFKEDLEKTKYLIDLYLKEFTDEK